MRLNRGGPAALLGAVLAVTGIVTAAYAGPAVSGTRGEWPNRKLLVETGWVEEH